MSKKITPENIIFTVLLIIAASSRLIAHHWNFTAVMAATLTFAFLFKDSKTKAVMLPVLAMLISDVIIGLNSTSIFHSTMTFVYVGFGLALVPAFLTQKQHSSAQTWLKRMSAIVAGSMIFYVISNFGVWLMDGMYPMTGEGFVQCYTMAIPFFKNQLVADLILTPVFVLVAQKIYALLPETGPGTVNVKS